MRYLNLLLILLISLNIKAQTKEVITKLSWEIVSVYTPEGEEQKILGFEGAQYDLSKTLLPSYFDIKELGNSSSLFYADLVDAEFIPVSMEEKQLLKEQQIGSDIEITVTSAIQRKKFFQQISFVPLRKNQQNGQLEKLVKFRLRLREAPQKKTVKRIKSHNYASTSLLANGKWIKISVDSSAVYKLTYEQLIDMGITQPERVRIYGSGGGMLPKMNSQDNSDDILLNSVWAEKGADGIFNAVDYILFYAQGPQQWLYDEEKEEFVHENHSYSDKSYYFLTSDLGNFLEMETITSTTENYNTTVTQFDDYRVVDQDDINLLKSGRLWVGQEFDVTTQYSFNFNFQNIVKNVPLKITAHLLARSSGETQFQLKSGSEHIGDIPLQGVNVSSYTSSYASNKEISFTNFFASDDIVKLDLEYQKNTSSNKGWMDFLRVNARRRLIMTGSQMAFRDLESVGEGNVSLFEIENVPLSLIIWDVTEAQSSKQIISQFIGNKTNFVVPTPTLHKFVAVDTQGDFPTPTVEAEIANQNLHGLPQADMIIISPNKFMNYAAQIADFHETQDSLKVILADPEAIYNEFSSGAPDVAAIRNFVRMFYNRANSENLPDYLLLFGDGSYDNKSEDENNTNKILTYQSENSLSPTQSFITDDFFCLLDDDEGEYTGLLDIGVGRLPVNTEEEAQIIVDKIINYNKSSNLGNWRTRVCFIGDDEDNNTHMRDANLLAEFVEKEYPEYQIQRIFLDAYPQQTTSAGQAYPEVNIAILENVNRGTLIMNYTGHGNENGLGHERVLMVDDILDWQNLDKMPLFMTASCEFSRFDNYRKLSAGEMILLRSKGGGIGLFTTTRLVFSAPNFLLNRNFYNYVFERVGGKHYRLGDIMRLTKMASGVGTNKRNFTLLGDPALKLNYPENVVQTISLNNVDISQQTDTLKALSRITITGQLEDSEGQKSNQFDGIIYITVYDKEVSKSTLGNDGVPFDYPEQKNILYKGKASVKQGQFSFTFMVPKDINYQYGTGKIAYYASSPDSDAAGYNKTIIVGGSSSESINDNEGPEINMYMNDELFVSGGITDSNPMLLAVVQDSIGINTVGTAIGHDIIAVIDDDQSKSIRLNDYYESELDNFQKGRITYQLTKIKEGEHKIQLKVWDNLNNSSESELDFLVARSAKLAISNLLNYPNPFTTNTGFYFEHNMPNREMDILIQILTVSGRLVKTIETTIISNGYRVGPISWDGKDDYGNNIGKGVYIYRVKIKSEDGRTVNKFQKLVLLK